MPDYQLSLAIGKEGQNVRLAAKLTGWKIDIKSQEQFEEYLEDRGITEEELAEEFENAKKEIPEEIENSDETIEINDSNAEGKDEDLIAEDSSDETKDTEEIEEKED